MFYTSSSGKWKRKKHFFDSFYEASLNLIPKPKAGSMKNLKVEFIIDINN